MGISLFRLEQELTRNGRGRILYLLDEPTTGLHPAGIARLLALLQKLAEVLGSALYGSCRA